MRIVYIIVKLLTLPGAVTHAFFEHLCCRSAKIIVEDARVIQANEMLSHIDHELVRRRGASFDLCFIPFFMNLMLGFFAISHGAVTVYYYGRFTDPFAWISLYLGISLFTNLFPQLEDALMLKENFFNRDGGKVSKIFVAPFYALFTAGAYIEKYGVTLLTAVAFSFAVPYIYGWFIPALYRLFQ